MKRRAIFVYFPRCEVLDFAGPLQAIHELNEYAREPYEIVHCGTTAAVTSAQGLSLAQLKPLPEPREGDCIFVPGFPAPASSMPQGLGPWLKAAVRAGARIFAVCTGAFVLAQTGLLDGRRCTTHWKRTDDLQWRYPRTTVVTGRLFVRDGAITTSAGISAGIDMTLDFIEQEHGAAVAAAVAREMVVYIRRDGAQKQESIYLDHRTHIDPAIHAVQDWLVAHPGSHSTLADLARIASTSTRTLTRAFFSATGVSISTYRQRLRLEHAKNLLANPQLSIERVAEEAGFSDARQLRRLWRAAYGESPRAARPGARPSAARA
jgi:transcriptional regulator GlxA family with amidase domain